MKWGALLEASFFVPALLILGMILLVSIRLLARFTDRFIL